MDKASAYGAGDCRFESCRGHCMRVSDMCPFSRKTRKSGEPDTRHTQRCQLTTLPPLPGRGIHVYIKISGSLNDHHTSAEIPPKKKEITRIINYKFPPPPPADKPCVSPSVCTVTITHMHAHMPCLVFPCVWDRRAHAHS